MADIFDEITTEQVSPKGDIFDQITTEEVQQPSQIVEFGKGIQRHVGRSLARAGETVLGIPGDVQQLI